MPQRQQYQRDQLLTNLSLAYTNADMTFIADVVFPTLKVNRNTGVYYEWDKSNLRAEHDLRAPGTPANEIDYAPTTKSFGPLLQHELKKKVTKEEVERSESPLAPFRTATRILTEKSKISKEIDAATKLAAASKGTTIATATDRWDDVDNSDPIGMLQDAVDAAKLNALKTPNTLVLGEQTVRPLLNHPDVLARLGDTQTRIARLDIIAELIGVKRVVVGDAARNTGLEGAADAISYIWGKNAYIMYINPNPSLEDVSAGYGLELSDNYEVSRWWNEDLKSTYVRISREYEHKITCQDGIYKLLSVVN